MKRLASVLTTCVALAGPLSGQADPRLVTAVRLAQEGMGDSARAVAGRVLSGTRPTDALYPEVLYTIAVVASTTQDKRLYLQRVAVEYSQSEWADDALLQLAQLDYAAGSPGGTVQQVRLLLRDYPASPVRARAALWGARAAFDVRDRALACQWANLGVGVIADRYGHSVLQRFFSVFLPPDASFGRFHASHTDAGQATFFVAAMSAAAGADLRADFRDNWGFPVNNATFNELYPQLIRLVAQHEPVVPGAPTGVTATAGNAQATVSFTPPTSDGGSPIISYTVTSNPGGITATGASSPITVTGLTNGTAYTFTVTATNEFGTGPASAPSNSVTPYIVTYFISGEVKTPGGTGLSGVLMTLGGAGSGTTTTNSLGSYQFTGLTSGSYTVTPSKSGYTFTPTSRNVTVRG